MNEKKRSFVVIAVIGIFLFILIMIGVIQRENENANLDEGNDSVTESYQGKYSTNHLEAFEGEEKKVLLIGSTSCSVCQAFTPYIKYLSEAYDFTYYYIDADTMSDEQLINILDKVDQDINDFGTPYIAFLQNGEKYDEIAGYVEESKLFEQLQKNEIIGSDETYVSSTEYSNSHNSENSSYKNLSFIGYDEYKNLYEGDSKFIVVLGQSGCGACTSYKPIIDELVEEIDAPIYYIDVTSMEQSDIYSLMDSLSYFDDVESWGTPLTLIVENKKVKDYLEGAANKNTTLEFLKDNGFEKKNN